MVDLPRQSWQDAEPDVLQRERAAMLAVAPDMDWLDGRAGAWEGIAPTWPFDRPQPTELEAFLDGRRLTLGVLYSEGFPMVPPRVYPLDPDPPLERRTMHKWHINGDGSLCLVQRAGDWQPNETAAELVRKAAAWFIEYLLVEAGQIEAMTEHSIVSDPVHDHLLVGGS